MRIREPVIRDAGLFKAHAMSWGSRPLPWAVLGLHILLGGCASWFLRGAEPTRRAPGSAVAVFTAPTCAHANGSATPGSQASYHLAQEAGEWVLYEVEASGRGARITNGWVDANGRHFFTWIRNGPGWVYTFPPGAGRPPARLVYPAGTYSLDRHGSVMRPIGTATLACPMLVRSSAAAMTGSPPFGAQPITGAQRIPGAQPIPGAVTRAQPRSGGHLRPGRAASGASSSEAAGPPMRPAHANPDGAPPRAGPTPRPTNPPDATPRPRWARDRAAPSVPSCDGDDPTRAAEAAARGRALYRRGARAHGGPDLEQVRRALAEFDRQCAFGDDWALELRASALFVLGREVEAMESLDAFLAAHPLSSLPSDVRARVGANLPLLERHVATLLPSASQPGASIRVNGGEWRSLDEAVLRISPGTARIEVAVDGRIVVEAFASFAAGSTYQRTYDVSPRRASTAPPDAATPAGAATAPAARRTESAMTRAEAAALESEAPPELGGRPDSSPGADTSSQATGSSSGGPDLVPWAVTAGVIAGLSLGVAIPLRVVSDGQYAQYLGADCPGSPRPECAIVLGESNATLQASTALFVGSGVLTAAAIVLAVLEGTIGGGEGTASTEPAARVVCAPGILGAVCRMPF